MKTHARMFAQGLVGSMVLTATLSSAAPLPDMTRLTIEPGENCGTSSETGSCTGFYASAGFILWYNLAPGSDGGIVIGKNQLSGGQELGPSSTNSQTGDMTAAWFHFANYATIATSPLLPGQSDASANIYSDTSCTGTNCAGLTEIGTWHYAWNGNPTALGTVDGNTDPACGYGAYGEQLFVRQWEVNQDNTYRLDYANCVPVGDSSSFGGVPFIFKLTGQIEMAPPVNITGTWQALLQNSTALYIFGEGFEPGTTIYLDGVYHQVMQRVSDEMLIAIVPGSGLTSTLEVRTPTNSASTTLSMPSPDVLGVTGVWPSAGQVNDFVFVFGSGFSINNTAVSVGGGTAFGQVVDEGLMVFMVNAQMSTGQVSVATPSASFTSEYSFTVLP